MNQNEKKRKINDENINMSDNQTHSDELISKIVNENTPGNAIDESLQSDESTKAIGAEKNAESLFDESNITPTSDELTDTFVETENTSEKSLDEPELTYDDSIYNEFSSDNKRYDEIDEKESDNVDIFDIQSGLNKKTPVEEEGGGGSRTQTKVAVLPKHLTDQYKRSSKNNKKSWFEPAGYTESVSTIHSVLKTVVYIIFITMMGCFLAYFAITRINDLYAFVKPTDEVEVTIPENATINEIGKILHDAGIIEYPDFFKIYAELKNASERYEFKSGKYVLNPMMNYDELFVTLEGTIERSIKRITIPEGYTVDEIIDLFVQEGLGTKEGFENVIQNYDFEYDFVEELDKLDLSGRKYRLEGYLFPDTYEVYTGKSETYYIYKLLDRFDEIFIQKYKDRATELGFTIDQIVTLSSMVEKEAKLAADFEGIACVFHNRLKKPATFPKLQSDATAVYAIQILTGERITEVLPEHLTVNSPFNTYIVDGLPAGPISCPGYQAITCTLYPGESSYYYFVSNLEGTTYYASTKSEHDKNIAKVKAENEEYIASQG